MIRATINRLDDHTTAEQHRDRVRRRAMDSRLHSNSSILSRAMISTNKIIMDMRGMTMVTRKIMAMEGIKTRMVDEGMENIKIWIEVGEGMVIRRRIRTTLPNRNIMPIQEVGECLRRIEEEGLRDRNSDRLPLMNIEVAMISEEVNKEEGIKVALHHREEEADLHSWNGLPARIQAVSIVVCDCLRLANESSERTSTNSKSAS
jgi:hypothetical protein